MTEKTVAYQVTQAIAGATDDQAYYEILKENDRLRQEVDNLNRMLVRVNKERAALYRTCSYAIGEIVSGRVRPGTAEVIERMLDEVGR